MHLGFLRDRTNALAFAWMINSLAYSIVYPFLSIYLHGERGYPMSQVGLIFPLMGSMLIAFPLFAGTLTDRIGSRPMMQMGQTLRATLFVILAVLAIYQAPLWLFAVVLMINAGIGTFFQIGADTYLSSFSRPEDRPRMFSRIRIGTNIGWALGPMLGSWLIGLPFWTLFLMTCALCLVGAWYTGHFCSNSVRHTESPASPSCSTRQLLADHWLVSTLGCSFALFLLSSQLYSTLSVYSTGVVGISARELGLIYSLNGFGIILFQVPVTALLERFRLTYPARLAIGASLYTIGYFSLGFDHNALMIAGSVILITLGEAATLPSVYSGVSSLAPTGITGRYMASLELIRGTGYALGPFLGAMMFDCWSSRPPLLWSVLSVFGFLAIVGFAWITRRMSSNQSQFSQLDYTRN